MNRRRAPGTGRSRRRQRGVAAVEFAIVFPVFFLILYGIITYSLIFALQQVLTLSAEDGARATLVYQAPGAGCAAGSCVSDALTARANQVCPTIVKDVSWLGPQVQRVISQNCVAPVPVSCDIHNVSMYCLTVTVSYPYNNTTALIPILPFMSAVMPGQLGGQAVVQIDPGTLL